MFGLGGGLVVLHGAYMECGIWTALVVNIALAALIGYCSCVSMIHTYIEITTLVPAKVTSTVNFSPLQSGFRPGHSTSSALLKVTGDIRRATEDANLTVLVLVDFSNAFNTCSYHLYADDLQLYRHAKAIDLTDTIDKINADLEVVKTWSDRFGVVVNSTKCQAIIIGGSRAMSKVDGLGLPTLVFNGVNIPYSCTVKNLGLHLDSTLNWQSQVAATLVWSAQKLYGRVVMPTLTYPDIMEATVLLCPWKLFRKTARCLRYLVEFTIMLNLYGSCCVLVIMIARNLKELVSGDNTINDTDDPPLKVYILILMLPCIIICMVTDLKILAPFALICDMFAVVLIVITLWYAFHNSKVSPLDRAPYRSVMGLFEFMSVCTFVLEPVSYALPVENNMNEPKKFHNVVIIAMSINTVAMITVGFVGFWHYGNFAVSPITVHLPFSPFAVTLKVGLCIILYVIYSMCFYVAFDVEWFYLKRHHQMSNYWFWERLYRTIHVIILIMVAYCLPNVTRLMGIVGALCTSPAVFIYPYFIELILDWEHPGLGRCKWRLLRFLVMLTFGLVLFVAGTYYNGLGMYLELQNPPKANISFDPENQMPELERKEIHFEISNELSVDPKKRLNITDQGKHNYDLNVSLPYEVPYNLFDQNLNTNYSTKKANIVFEYYNTTLINNFTTNLRRNENLATKANGTLNITPDNKNLIINIILPDINNYTVLFNSTTPIMPVFNNATALDNNVTNTLSSQ
ncbi:uncharacterized protein LOC124642877 [Helicoverpa zea]|uniref:uncharacterized protein LOC124642877 n=1 Tax=Helicoverpa zea TaxID=7113 RepID=UPI001F563D16|nr:uncharacterized protein LOC124642877 [Helicoverpa zea]